MRIYTVPDVNPVSTLLGEVQSIDSPNAGDQVALSLDHCTFMPSQLPDPDGVNATLNVPPDTWLMLLSVGSGQGGCVVVLVVVVVVEVVVVLVVVVVGAAVVVLVVDVVLVVVVVAQLPCVTIEPLLLI